MRLKDEVEQEESGLAYAFICSPRSDMRLRSVVFDIK